MLARLFSRCIGSSSTDVERIKDEDKIQAEMPRSAWGPSKTDLMLMVDDRTKILAIKQDPYMLKAIKYDLRTIDQCKLALIGNPKTIKYVPRRYRTDPDFLAWMVKENDKLCSIAICLCPKMLEHAPKTLDNCLDAVMRDFEMMVRVPKEHVAYILKQVKSAKAEYDSVNWLA